MALEEILQPLAGKQMAEVAAVVQIRQMKKRNV